MDRPEVPPEKRPSVSSAQALPRPFGFQVAGGVKHFLHAGAAFRAFVRITTTSPATIWSFQDGFDGGVLAFKDAHAAGKGEDGFVHASGFHDAAALGDVAEQHGQAAVLRIGVLPLRRMQPFGAVESSSARGSG